MGKMTCQVLLGAILVAGVAHADTKLDEAKSHLQSGAALYDGNDLRGALVEFQRAYELAPSYKILFNIAQVEMELQDHAGAFKAYTRYVKEGGPDIAPARLALVNAEIERLRGRVGFLAIQTSAGAIVLIDDVQVGYAPLPEPIAVNAGRHRVTIEVPRREPVTRVFDVSGRQEVAAVLVFETPVSASVAAAPVTAVTVPAEPPKPPPKNSKVPVYVAWSVTGGFAVAAGVFAVIAHRNANELASLRSSFPVTSDQLEAQRSKTVRNARITDVLTGAAVASAGVALYLALTRTSADARPPKEKAVELHIAPTGVAIAGRF
jgi:hypothetical protein